MMEKLRAYFTPFELYMLKQCHVTTYSMVYNYMAWHNLSMSRLYDPEIKARIYHELCAYGIRVEMELMGMTPKTPSIYIHIDYYNITPQADMTISQWHAYK